jgi:hypothetical protein
LFESKEEGAMTTSVMIVALAICAMIGVFSTILYFKMDNIEDEVYEIKRKMERK